MAADERCLRTASERLARYWERHGLQGPMPLDWIAACRDPDGVIIDAAVDYAHPSGTVRMGTNRTGSVVGPDLVCHDLANLSVVSAAVFPCAGSANPTFTLLALALHHADALLAKRVRAGIPHVRSARANDPAPAVPVPPA
ncbi:MAG: hypothetical protein EOP02_17865 [Proteobacteria bacterium]|nr:MAG: hypothetical protein EOP02_17865 [Pseudomonadota bacterium]